MKAKLVAVLLGALVASMPLAAHHSFQSEYDTTKTVRVTGKMVKFEWTNPHSWVHVEVIHPDGKKTIWRAETLPVNLLYRQGWTKPQAEALVGQTVTISGPAARDGSNHIWGSNVTTDKGQIFQLNGAPPTD